LESDDSNDESKSELRTNEILDLNFIDYQKNNLTSKIQPNDISKLQYSRILYQINNKDIIKI